MYDAYIVQKKIAFVLKRCSYVSERRITIRIYTINTVNISIYIHNVINVTIRREMGTDINAACGQLRKTHIESHNPL